ncbi:MAG: DUF2281 domain-containing protein [Microcystis sp.]
MSIDLVLKNIVENMPDTLKTELLHYAEYLLTKSDQTEEDKQASQASVTVKKTLAGSMKGTFVLPLADDFDAPLEDFEDYM